MAEIGGTPCPPGYTKVLFAGLPTCEKRTATGVLRSIQGQPKPEIIRRAAAAAQVAQEDPGFTSSLPPAIIPPPTHDIAAQEVEPMPTKSFASVNIAPPGIPDPSQGFNIGGAIVGGLTGLLTGGPGGALVGAVGGSGLLGEGSDVPDVGMPGGTSLLGGCPPGYKPTSDGGCAPTLTTSVQAALPGGASGAYPDSYGGAVMGAFGVPALQPAVVTQAVRRCPPGAVLGRDGLCYTKGSIPPKYRAYRPKPKPVVSRADFKAIQRADRARKRLINLTKKAGAYASMKKPTSGRGSRGVITKSEAARALRK